MKTCPRCQGRVIGRSDKVFCSDDCRSSYHYQQKKKLPFEIKKINKILLKNRKILLEFQDNNICQLSKELLETKGYNFNYYTQTEIRSGRRQVFHCYERSFELRGNKVFIPGTLPKD